MPKSYLKSKTKEGGPLTPTQLQNRQRRRMLMRRMRGLETPRGATQRWPSTGEPVFKPMPRPAIYGFSDHALGALMGLIALLPGMRRRRKEAQLAEEQRSQSIKAKGR